MNICVGFPLAVKKGNKSELQRECYRPPMMTNDPYEKGAARLMLVMDVLLPVLVGIAITVLATFLFG